MIAREETRTTTPNDAPPPRPELPLHVHVIHVFIFHYRYSFLAACMPVTSWATFCLLQGCGKYVLTVLNDYVRVFLGIFNQQ